MPLKKNKTPLKKEIKPIKKKAVLETEDSSFPIVGIGASAGGLEALEGFFSHVPPNPNMAFVVIQHLAPKHKSIMDALLRRVTVMNITEVQSGMKLQPGRVYLNHPIRMWPF